MGTSVRACPTLTSAIQYVVGTLRNEWAAGWVITGPDGEVIAESPGHDPVVSGPDYDKEHHATSPLLHLPHD